MPSKKKAPVRGSPEWPLPAMPKEFMDKFVEGPMTAAAVEDLSAAFKKALIERAIGAELSHHLGYKPGEVKPDGAANYRNGTTRKKVLTDAGPVHLDLPRDRLGNFEPILIPKHERRYTGFDDKIIAMYARGMTLREIRAFLAEQYGCEVSPPKFDTKCAKCLICIDRGLQIATTRGPSFIRKCSNKSERKSTSEGVYKWVD